MSLDAVIAPTRYPQSAGMRHDGRWSFADAADHCSVPGSSPFQACSG